MKRWQDRGEVQDSDDEELSLGAESQSPERPAKRARLEDAGTEIANENVGGASEGQGEGEDELEDWLQPKPAITHGGNTIARAAYAIEARDAPSEEAPSETATICATPVKSITPTQPEVIDHFTSSQSSDCGDLPDVQDILAGRANIVGVQQIDGQPISAPSSPLTERDVSPSPPADYDGFRFSPLQLAFKRTAPPNSTHSDDEAISRRDTSELRTLAAQSRRNLRTRKEKQLHPYMFDKAQYQQQCRERGMRPVRVMEAEQNTAETQDGLASGDESLSSQIVYGNSSPSPARQSPIVRPSSPARAGSPNLFRNGELSSNDDLPDLRPTLTRSIPEGIQQGSKRRRLFSTTRRSADLRSRDSGRDLDELSVPPSPPPTSSDQRVHFQPEAGRPIFRIPRGLTPLPLATPRVSSDVRRARVEDETDISDAELPSKRSGSPTLTRTRPLPLPISSSSEASEAEEKQQFDERRLHRERKRIKGVLPASWLKIDFRAQQQPMLPRVRRGSFSSPERVSPQKGVAQRIVSNRLSSSNRPNIIDISDDESDATSNRKDTSPSPPRMRQPKLQFDSGQRRAARQAFIDVDEMEVDWIDPMFARSSSKSGGLSSKKRQPKIAEAFRASATHRKDFSEERRGLSHRVGTVQCRDRPVKNIRQHKSQQSTAPRLSIVDAPAQDTGSQSIQPQFVRIAIRQARRRSDKARQSPSHKQIRLATREDTQDASTVLLAWRKGTFVPRQTVPNVDNPRILPASNTQCIPVTNIQHQARVPLAELSGNPQRRLPSPIRKEPKQLNINQLTASTQRRPQLQQTQLDPELLQREQRTQASQRPEVTVRPTQRPRLNRVQPMRAPYRGAQLESLESEFDQSHRATAFERRMQLLTESAARCGKNAGTDQMDRFLYGSGATASAGLHATNANFVMPKNTEAPGPKEALPHRVRKRPPQRVDAEAREYRQPSEPLPDVIDVDQLPDNLPEQPDTVLQGLGPVDTRYATDFDILPLPMGTYFHQSTFIGSGDFAAALKFADRDLDEATGRITIHIEGEILEWGVWTEDVAAGLARVPRAVSAALQTLQTSQGLQSSDAASLVMSNVDYLLRSSTRYFSRCLAFLDPVDRKSCTERIQRFVDDLFEAIDESGSCAPTSDEITTRCFQYALVIAKQALTLCDHRSIGTDTKRNCRKLVDRAAHRLATKHLARWLSELRSFYDDSRHASVREAGIRDHNVAVASFVILYHVLDEPGIQSSPFWTLIYQHLDVIEATIASFPQLDKVWYDLFTLLPILEIDAYGIAQVGARLHSSQEGWSLVKRLLERLLGFYDNTCVRHGSTINDYFRATFTRCYRLVARWGWWKCESILGTIFDFFARRGLAQLHKEESRGSPRFLEELKDGPSLEVQAEDRSFNIFLKTLASGLIGMPQHQIYTAKKIGGIAWRFIPNHGRTYRKDAEVQQKDLDALRHHHDLLCTLYYATPSTHRLRVDLVRNLVDHSASHREACRLSVRAWANLAAFQMSTDEGDEQLEPFANWYREMVTITMSQYRLARNEVEQEVESARAQGQMPVPQHLIDDTIARNQRQISATLVDLLAALQRALKAASCLRKAQCLLNGCLFWDVFALYQPSARRLNSVLEEALATVQTSLQVEDAFLLGTESQSNSEESQDYGDSSALQEFASSEPPVESKYDSSATLLHEPVSQLVSNVFGADAVSDDTLLTKVVDTWIQLAQRKVRSGESSWTHYLNDCTSAAWSQLRDTEQRRKLTPYFLSKMVDASSLDLNLNETGILTSWLESLVEREAMLKNQHELTNALLDGHPDHSLLRNLPFSRHSNGLFNISLHELRERRLSLLSSVLSNMRDALDREPPSKSQVRYSRVVPPVGNKSSYTRLHKLEISISLPAETHYID